MVEDVRRMAAHNDADVTRWIEVFETSLVEQTKYEDWREKMTYANDARRAELVKEREAALEPYRENGQLDLAPDWLFAYFNPRLGPAKPCAWMI